MSTQAPTPQQLGWLLLLFKVWATLAALLFWGLPWLLLVALVWRPCRYPLLWLAMAGIRRYVVQNVRPNAGQLPDPGGVSDPDAPWRMWLDPRSCQT